jgi:hypothetical protein
MLIAAQPTHHCLQRLLPGLLLHNVYAGSHQLLLVLLLLLLLLLKEPVALMALQVCRAAHARQPAQQGQLSAGSKSCCCWLLLELAHRVPAAACLPKLPGAAFAVLCF